MYVYSKIIKPWAGRIHTEFIRMLASKSRERNKNIPGDEIKRDFHFICEFKNFGMKYKKLKYKKLNIIFTMVTCLFTPKPHIFPSCLKIVSLKIECASESLGGLDKTQISGPTPQISDSVDLRLGPRSCFSNKLPGDSNVIGPGPQFENKCIIIQLPTSEHSFRF